MKIKSNQNKKQKQCKYCKELCNENYIVCKKRQCQNIACWEDRHKLPKITDSYFKERAQNSPISKDELIGYGIDSSKWSC